jgi:hypothetical protein
MRHQAGDEMHITAKPIQFCDGHRTPAASRFGESGGELRTTI